MNTNKPHFKTTVFIALIAIVSLVLAACSPNTGSSSPEASILDDSAKATAELSIPSNAIKLTECLPNMGAHYVNPANLPFGPIYLTDKEENIIAIEYMIHEDDLKENILEFEGGHKYGKPVVMPALDIAFDHVELNYAPEGHKGGDEEPHYDLHMYLVSAEEQAKACQ